MTAGDGTVEREWILEVIARERDRDIENGFWKAVGKRERMDHGRGRIAAANADLLQKEDLLLRKELFLHHFKESSITRGSREGEGAGGRGRE